MMNTRIAWFFVVAAAGFAVEAGGCGDGGSASTLPAPNPDTSTGNTNTTTGMPTTAREYFEVEVAPNLDAECAFCHDKDGLDTAPEFLATSPAGTYDLVGTTGYITPAECSPLVVKPKGDHPGPVYGAALESKLITWLGMEVTENGVACAGTGSGSSGTGPGGGPDPLEQCNLAIDSFQACMATSGEDYWEASGLVPLPYSQTDGGGPCQGCHALGMAGAYLNIDPGLMFQAHSTDKGFLQKLARCDFDANSGAFLGMVHSERFPMKGLEACGAPPCHPSFIFGAPLITALDDYVNNVYQASVANTCDQLLGQ